MLARLARVLLVAALLLAQAAAIGHSLWHATAHGAKAHVGAIGLTVPKNPLCEFHGALDAVLCALSGAPPATQLAAVSDIAFIAAASPAAPLFAPAPQSRGPPAPL